LNYAQKDGLLTTPPFPKLAIGLKGEIKYLTYEQQKNVLAAIPESHRGIFELAMEYGLRIGEVIALQKDCVTDTEIIIKRAMSDGELRNTTKTGKTRCYGITGRAKEILDNVVQIHSPRPYFHNKFNVYSTSFCFSNVSLIWPLN